MSDENKTFCVILLIKTQMKTPEVQSIFEGVHGIASKC